MRYYFKKNTFAIVISIILVVASFAFCVFINGDGFVNGDLEIKEYKINLKINKDGSGSFDNYITYKFNNYYVAIYEDISANKGNIFSYGNKDNNEVKYLENKEEDTSNFDLNSFETHAYQNGEEIKLSQIGYSFNYDIEKDTGEYVTSPYYGQERIFCLNEDGYNQDTMFNYKYRIVGMVSKYQDIGIINWILSPSTDILIENLSVNITFEEELTEEYVAHLKDNTYVHGNVQLKEDPLISKEGIKFEVAKQRSSQSVEVRLGFDNSLVEDTASINTYDYLAQEHLNKVEALTEQGFKEYTERYYAIQTGLFIVLALAIAFITYLWYSIYKKYDKERVSTFDSEYYRELPNTYPPAELGYLYNFKETTKDDLSATIMDLIRKDFIKLDTNGYFTTDEKPNYIYRYNRSKDTSSLKNYERFVLVWYFDHMGKNDTLSLYEIEEYLSIESQAKQYLEDNKYFIELVRMDARGQNFFDKIVKLNIKYSWVYALLGINILLCISWQILNFYTYALVFSVCFLALWILLGSYIASIKRRSETGNEDYVRWKAFRNFLLNFGRFEDYTMPLIEIWEHYMVYAVSFGIADEVIKQMHLKFKSLGEDKYDSYVGSSIILTTNSHHHIRSSCYSSSSQAQSTIAQAQAARASKSGGSSFGGGRSFGGGGGGHGGR